MEKKILIVEDDSLISTIFRMFIKELGYDLLSIIADGKDAVTFCEQNKPDIVLMDVHLSGEMDGVQAAEIILNKLDIPIVFLSSDTHESTIKRVINTNSYGYLIKPIDKRELGITIELAFYKHKFDMETRDREARFRRFISELPEAIIIVNYNYVIEYINCKGLDLLKNHYIEDVIGQKISNYICSAHELKFFNVLDTAREKIKSIDHTNISLNNCNGENISVQFSGSFIDFNNKESLLLLFRNRK